MAIDGETERLMQNWAAWRGGGGREKRGLVSSAYSLEARGRREEVSIPLFDPEASEVNDAVQSLSDKLQEAVHEYWLRAGAIADKARRCGCPSSTLYRRLDRAHVKIRAFRAALRERLRRRPKPLLHSYC